MSISDTDRDDYMHLASATDHATEHMNAAAEHLDEIITATEQMQRMRISATTPAAIPANAARDAERVTTAQVIPQALRKEILVEFNHDMWWMMPAELSTDILSEWQNGSTQVSFVWDWRETRIGSFQLDGECTSLSRYIIDFQTMLQRNIDNNRTRRIKVVSIIQ